VNPIENCTICSRYLENSADYLSAGHSGICHGCWQVKNGKAAYYECEKCNDQCVVQLWAKPYFEEYGQTTELLDGRQVVDCVEYLNNGGMSILIMQGAKRKHNSIQS